MKKTQVTPSPIPLILNFPNERPMAQQSDMTATALIAGTSKHNPCQSHCKKSIVIVAKDYTSKTASHCILQSAAVIISFNEGRSYGKTLEIANLQYKKASFSLSLSIFLAVLPPGIVMVGEKSNISYSFISSLKMRVRNWEVVSDRFFFVTSVLSCSSLESPAG